MLLNKKVFTNNKQYSQFFQDKAFSLILVKDNSFKNTIYQENVHPRNTEKLLYKGHPER